MLVNSPIRVLITDDSAFMRVALTRMIESDPEIEVCGTATNGRDALQKLAALDPDVVTLDVEMPELNGIDTLRQIMARAPRPVIMVSSLTREGAETSLDALDHGAFDCVAKPASYASMDVVRIREELLSKLKAAGISRRRRMPSLGSSGGSGSSGSPATTAPAVKPASPLRAIPALASHPTTAPALVCIGTSTGGPKALQDVIGNLPQDLSVGVVVVQHMPVGFTASLAVRLNSISTISVREAKHGDRVEPGLVLIAPAGQHLTFLRLAGGRLTVQLSHEPAHSLHIPSVDNMMLSAAAVCGPTAMGVIMTGMGADGAQGMKAIHAAGGFNIGQDEATSVVYGMPRACAEMGTLNRVVPLGQIAKEIVTALASRGPSCLAAATANSSTARLAAKR